MDGSKPTISNDMSTTEGGGGIITNGLILYIDPINTQSYISGSTKCYNLIRNFSKVGSPAITPAINIFGTLYNGISFNNSNGSFIFDGTNDYIDLTPHYLPYFTLNSKITLISWFKTSNNSSSGANIFPKNTIFGELEDAGMSGVGVDLGYLSIYYYDYLTPTWRTIRATGTTVSDNNWHHVAFVLDTTQTPSPTSNWSVYLDGQILVNQQLLNGFYYNWIDGIGVTRYGGYFNGSIGLTQIYNRLLTENEIFRNYKITKGRFGL